VGREQARGGGNEAELELTFLPPSPFFLPSIQNHVVNEGTNVRRSVHNVPVASDPPSRFVFFFSLPSDRRPRACRAQRPRPLSFLHQCLYPVEIKKTVYKAYGESATSTPPSNAAASSSRITTTPPSTTPPFSPPPNASTSIYKTPTSDLELSYPDPTERLLVRNLPFCLAVQNQIQTPQHHQIKG